MSFRFASKVKELRLHFCQTSPTSKGVRDFVAGTYAQLKKTNPTTPILVRECSGVQPRVWARLDNGAEKNAILTNLDSQGVAEKIKGLTC